MGYTISLSIGIVLLVVSLFLLKESIAFIKRGNRAIATVIRLEKVSDSDGDSYRPIFQFKTSFNQEVTYKYTTSSSPASWDIGEKATVVYEANNPNNAKLLTYFGAFAWSVIFMAIAMPLIIIGGGYYILQPFLK